MEVTVEETSEMISRDSVVLLDVREGWERDICAIKNDVHIPMREIQSRLDELPKKKKIIVYCHTGNRSLKAANFLKQMGFNAVSMKGGVEDWALKIDGSMGRY
ncbi:MAG: rhodanese-like domain-containing protein [Candidatus Aenigmarchaeota archaeon]|nr:rhodanese-like domain-containing protein [Candidatus Aenigmarchaeota archaeon]